MSVAMIGVGVSAAAGIYGASQAGKAGKAQAQAASDANATQMAQYNQTRDDQAPWRASGSAALNALNVGLGLENAYSAPEQNASNFNADAYLAAHPEVADPTKWAGDAYSHYLQFGKGFGFDYTGTNSYNSQLTRSQNPQTSAGQAGFGDLNRKFTANDFTADPGYEFRMAEGARGINNSAAARGGVLSGAALKAASKYNQNFASNEYSNAYNRFNTDQTNSFNRLASIAGVGQTATNQVAAAGQNMANNVSQNQLGAGNARASGYIGQSNALTGGLAQGFNMYQQNQAMNSLGNGSTSSYGFGAQRDLGGYNALANGGWGIE